MSEPENLCVCTHVLLPLSTVSPKRQFPFLTNSASLPCLGRHHSSKQHCKIWLPNPPWCTCGGKNIHLMSTVVSSVTGRARELEAADALDGFWRPAPHCGKGHTGFGWAHRAPIGLEQQQSYIELFLAIHHILKTQFHSSFLLEQLLCPSKGR